MALKLITELNPALPDDITLILGDGRIVQGKALIVTDPNDVDGGGNITASFDFVPQISGQIVCIAVLLTRPMSSRETIAIN